MINSTESPKLPHSPIDRIHAIFTESLNSNDPLELLESLEFLDDPELPIPTEYRELLELMRTLDFAQLAQLLIDYEYCPLHRCDHEICIDDQIHR